MGRDILYLASGVVVEVEEEMTEASVPSAVAAAIAKRYPNATSAKREKLTKGAAISYEMQLKGAPVPEIVLSPDGTWISPKAPKAASK